MEYWVEPAYVFSQIAHLPGSILLESQPGSVAGRYSIILTEPFGTLVTANELTSLTLPGVTTEGVDSPFDKLREVLSTFAMPCTSQAAFAGCAAGYFGYELRTYTENCRTFLPDDMGLPDCWIGFYNHAAVFDHQDRTISVNGCMLPGMPDPDLAALEDLILQAPEIAQTASSCAADTPVSVFTKAEYCKAVEKVKDYIAAGDIYQANISQRFMTPAEMDPWDMYIRLRESNPAPYAAYLNVGDFQIISSSPECFLTYDPGSRLVETKPIKGTRPRSPDPAEDRRLALELSTSEKDLAENVMIVDLERNDLGRVCEFGSVSVPELTIIESHPTVHHLVSTVNGRLRPDCDSMDLLTASFPGGSITGAPKIRAMEIIDELEPVRRGVYTGSIGYLGFDGSVNLNIAIRTAVVKDGKCHFHVGGGIVADSDPEMEYQETLDKGRAFFEVLR